jgi:[acyl-carrier-protein] S-malonyltransferase
VTEKTAIAFPGMGPSTFADLARFLVVNADARRLTRQAGEVLGYRLLDRFRESPDGPSEYADVAFLITCLALAAWAETDAEICAGASFGTKAAAVHSGVLTFPDAVLMTARMARCERRYFAAQHGDLVTQSFARVPPGPLAEIRAEMQDRGEYQEISCYVDHDFTMLTVAEHALDRLQQRLRQVGGLPIYTMRPAMHASVLTGLRAAVQEEAMTGLTFADPVLPILSDQDGMPLSDGAAVRAMLLDGYVRPVDWPAVVAGLQTAGVTRLAICGPDSLFGRVECTRAAFTLLPADPRRALRPRKVKPLTPAAG